MNVEKMKNIKVDIYIYIADIKNTNFISIGNIFNGNLTISTIPITTIIMRLKSK